MTQKNKILNFKLYNRILVFIGNIYKKATFVKVNFLLDNYTYSKFES